MDINFTPREKEVASYLVKGCTNYQIAHSMKISTHMVKIYLKSMSDKLNAQNRTELAYLLGKNNII